MGSTPAAAAPCLAAVGQIALTVRDAAAAAAFYRDKLGMKLLFEFPGLAFFDCAGIRLMLNGSENPGETYSSIVYFKVADIQAMYDALRSRDVPFEREPHLVARMPDHELWMAFFRDPDRNLLALMSEVRPQA
jgi:methylmalonyl-CoA/ethylmalonyl-CoA epimerase